MSDDMIHTFWGFGVEVGFRVPRCSTTNPNLIGVCIVGVMATPRSEGTPYDVTYGHTRVFVGADHAVILERMHASLMKQGFRVLSSIDLQQSLKTSKVGCSYI